MRHSMKKTTPKKSRLPAGVPEALAAIGIFLAVFLAIVIIRYNSTPAETPEDTAVTIPVETSAEKSIADNITLPLTLADGISLTGMYAVDALFPEDGSNAGGTNLLCCVVKNDTDKTLEYMTFTLTTGEETYEFALSTLPPACELYAFEKNAAEAPEKITDLTAETQIQLFFDEELTLMKDQLEITIGNGSIDVKNITDTPTDREIQVYYKNTENLAYFGGITYFLRVPAGLAPGETYNGYAANASTSRTEVMFVKYGN